MTTGDDDDPCPRRARSSPTSTAAPDRDMLYIGLYSEPSIAICGQYSCNQVTRVVFVSHFGITFRTKRLYNARRRTMTRGTVRRLALRCQIRCERSLTYRSLALYLVPHRYEFGSDDDPVVNGPAGNSDRHVLVPVTLH